MADREWYRATGSGESFTNLESASDYAEEYAASTGNDATIVLCTETPVRRYRRTVTVVAEDVTPQA
jgi:hypothetical protein